MKKEENQVVVPINEGYACIKVTGVLNADIYAKMEPEEVNAFIKQDVDTKTRHFMSDEYVGDMDVSAEYIVINHLYEKVAEITRKYVFNWKKGLTENK